MVDGRWQKQDKESMVPSAALEAGSGRWRSEGKNDWVICRLRDQKRLQVEPKSANQQIGKFVQPHWPEPWQARMGEAHKFGSAFMPSGPMQVWVYMHQKL